jgi:hypothetical protein
MNPFRSTCHNCNCIIPYKRAILNYTTCLSCSDQFTKRRWMYDTYDEHDCVTSHLTYETNKTNIQLYEETDSPYSESNESL